MKKDKIVYCRCGNSSPLKLIRKQALILDRRKERLLKIKFYCSVVIVSILLLALNFFGLHPATVGTHMTNGAIIGVLVVMVILVELTCYNRRKLINKPTPEVSFVVSMEET